MRNPTRVARNLIAMSAHLDTAGRRRGESWD